MTGRFGKMEYGAFFIPKADWPEAVAAGLSYCVRPIVTPDPGDGAGFVTKPVVVDMRTGAVAWDYIQDEADASHVTPAELTERCANLDAYFSVSLGTLGAPAARYAKCAPRALRGVNAYVGGDLHGPLDWWHRGEGLLALWLTARAWWRGIPWVGVANAIQGGALDRASSRSLSPAAVVEQVRRLQRLGARHVWFWRWDVPWGRQTILDALRGL